MSEEILIMSNISKVFGDVIANRAINLQVKKGTIHSIVGENGAGKSTLMKILYGMYSPTTGEIIFKGKKRPQNYNPLDAVRDGIGMVHQHFMLIPPFTVYENIILGFEPRQGAFIDKKKALQDIKELSEKFDLRVDPKARVADLSVGEQQRVEILKILYRRADLIILDEPTAVLTPQEVAHLFEILRLMKKEGRTILLITHKLKEVLAISDYVTVLRRGEVIVTKPTPEVTEEQLANYMVGRPVLLSVEKKERQPEATVLRVNNLTVRDNRGIEKVSNVSFEVRAGEILGIAGVEGNGQSELVEAITGLRRPESGEVSILEKQFAFTSSREFFNAGGAHIPEDRHKFGIILDFKNYENLILGKQFLFYYQRYGFLRYGSIMRHAHRLMEEYDIRPRDVELPTRSLSGGNQQKLVVAREMYRQPVLLIASQPTRGVDIGAIEFIHKKIVEQRDRGCAVLLISAELSEILSLSDRILVMYEGRFVKEFVNKGITEEDIGKYMLGYTDEKAEVAN